jgi:isopenicillin-N epimerase
MNSALVESVNALRQPAADPNLWLLDPEIAFLNHGSFGACPKKVLEYQRELRDSLEREPITFLVREFEARLDAARASAAAFLGANASDVVFVPNATGGINTVLRSLDFESGDELLVTNHEYNASRNVLDFAAARSGAKVVVAPIPFPIRTEEEVLTAILERVTRRTRFALIDHVTSQTAMVLPLERIVRELESRGIRTLVDGAHAPGMVPVNLKEIGASYYTGNCHKWMCAPKTAAILHVRPDFQKEIRPLIISHGANSSRTDRSRFLLEFGWMGTGDPSAALSVPTAIEYLGSLTEEGWAGIMARNRALALAARKSLCEALQIEEPCPEAMIGSMASVPIPDAATTTPPKSPLYLDELQERLFSEFKIEVPVIPWPAPPERLLRVSAQLYNSLPQYQRLAEVLGDTFRERP